MSASEECNLFWPQSTYCSGNGDCTAGMCVCHEGFSSIGDFAVVEGLDCDIHLLAVRILYAFGIFLSPFPFILSIRYFYHRHKSIAVGTTQKFFMAINYIPICAMIYSSAFLILCSLKVYDSEMYAIGISPLTTFLLGVCFYIGWVMQFIYLYIFSDMVIKQARIKSSEFREKSLKQLSLIKKFSVGLSALDFIWAFLPMIIIAVPSALPVVAAFHYIGASLNYFIAAVFMLPRTLIPVRDDIIDALKQLGIDPKSVSSMPLAKSPSSLESKVGISNSKTQAMLEAQHKLSLLIGFLQRSTIQDIILACIFGLWPFFLHKASYQLPFTYSLAIIVMSIEVHSISNFKTKSTAGASSPLKNSRFDDEKDTLTVGTKGTKNRVESQTQVGVVPSPSVSETDP